LLSLAFLNNENKFRKMNMKSTALGLLGLAAIAESFGGLTDEQKAEINKRKFSHYSFTPKQWAKRKKKTSIQKHSRMINRKAP
jgi:hypothetical protein